MDNYNDLIEELSSFYGLEKEVVVSLLNGLLEKECVNEINIEDCMNLLCQKKLSIQIIFESYIKMRKNEKKPIRKSYFEKYEFSDNYLINSAISIVCDDAKDFLDPEYIELITEKPRKNIVLPYPEKENGYTMNKILEYQYNGKLSDEYED